MYKCINKSAGNLNHLEQMVGDFFPYSQSKLGFDQPATIIFQSDKRNSSKLLGKTAFYDPASYEVVLYVDGRHPKDIMRSLSHELVHHAQNCRGDFPTSRATPEGYAQKDPHLRKMEREAYTKGNLIFRDYEDLIKTGKKEVDVDFSKSGEPKMSLKEWKDNELNMLLMKKWGLLKEGCLAGHYTGEDKKEEEELGEGWGYRDEDEEESPWGPSRRHANPIKALTAKDYEGIGSEESEDEEGNRPSLYDPLKKGKGLEEGDPLMKQFPKGHRMTGTSSRERLAYEKDPAAFMTQDQALELGIDPDVARSAVDWDPTAEHPDDRRDMRHPHQGGHQVGLGTARRKWRKAFAGQFKEGKISVREAKQITRRIIERIRKEGK